MKVAFVGPSNLTSFDKSEIEHHIKDIISKGHEVHILAYRSIESEIFRFFIEYIDQKKNEVKEIQKLIDSGEYNPTPEELYSLYDSIDLSNKLTIYTFQTTENLPERIKVPIKYLTANGSNHISFEHEDLIIYRSEYVSAWDMILKECDVLLSFFNGENMKTAYIPVDVAKKCKKTAFIYHLPGEDEFKFNLPPDEKMEKIASNLNENLV